MLLKLLLISAIGLLAAEKVTYDNYALYKVHPKCEEHVKFLKKLEETDDSLDFWLSPSRPDQYASVMIPPERREEFEHSLKKRSIFSELVVENVQEKSLDVKRQIGDLDFSEPSAAIHCTQHIETVDDIFLHKVLALDAQTQFSRRRKRNASPEMFWTNYQTLEDINAWFEHLAETYSDIVTLISAGTSYQGRNLTGIKISRGTSNRVFLLEGGQVGADWLSPTVLTYIVDQLVKGEDPEALLATQEFEWHIFPVVNPDGFEFSQDSVRLWVKNRRPTGTSTIGVDLSKNWNSQWGVSGGSHNPAANNFIGIGPFTEPETRSLSRYIENHGDRLTGFLAFRSFGQRLVIPFAHTTEPMYNYNEMVTIGRRAMGSLAVKYNTIYFVGTSKAVLDGTTGQITDWVKYRFNPPIAATYFLRDQGGMGYTLPVVQVLPSCEETYDSLMAILREARLINMI